MPHLSPCLLRRYMNIVLIGYRCSGKSSVGKILARELKRELLDTDAWIEETAGCPIETLISQKGWGHFRDMEKRVIKEISQKDNLVIATGGGVVTDKENVRDLRQNGWVVWLDAKADVFRERMEREQGSGKYRPSLTETDPVEEITQVLTIRRPLYKEAGDLRVNTGILSVREVADLILDALPKGLER